MIRHVIGTDGRMRMESDLGNLRIDLSTGRVERIIARSGDVMTFVGPDGRIRGELGCGPIRHDLPRPGKPDVRA